MPSGTGRVVLAAPLSQDIAGSLRYPPRSGGTAGLALASFIGFGQMGTLFLTGNPLSLLMYGLFPPEVQATVSWGSWLLAALPAHLVLFGLTLGFIVWRYRPEEPEGVPVGTIALQRRVLGRLTRDEWLALGAVVVLLVGLSTQSLHHVDPAWIAIAVLAFLLLAGVLTDDGFQHGLNLGFLVYLGVILGFGQVFTQVQLDQWLSQRLSGLAGLAGGSQVVFIVVIGLVAALCGIVFRPGPIGVVLSLALFQTASGLGVHPWVVAFTVLLAMQLFVYPTQNTTYLTAYEGTAQQGFSHAQARPLAILYPVAVFIDLVVSIPVWHWLGLLS
jgi:DASS family divalent anion:Na+ symporter